VTGAAGAAAGVAGSTLQGLLERSLHEHAARRALVCDGVELSYRELEEASRAAAHELHRAGVQARDRVSILLSNGIEYPVWDTAIVRLGCVKIPLNDMLTAGDIAYILRHSGVKAVVAGAALLPLLEAALAELDGPPPVLVVVDGLPAQPLAPPPPAASFLEPVAPGDSAAIYYTGGTTGRPKAIVHSQRNMALNLISHLLEAEIGRDERILVTTPLPHAAGLFTTTGLARGATVFVERRFTSDDLLAAVERHRITLTFVVPTMLYRILDAPALVAADVSSLRTIVYGAAPINRERLVEALGVFGPVFIQLYGQTECPDFAVSLSKADHLAIGERPEILASCGRAVLMAEITVRDDSGTELPVGETGEVCIRAPYTMDGYLDDPDGTAARFHGDWLRSGDIGALDEEGYLYLKDRKSDMVISGGMNVYTTVVERAIADCPGVRQVAVIGVPDPIWGEAVHAVVTVDGNAADGVPAQVLAHCGERLARYMRPKSVEIVDAMPLTQYGKVDKKALRAPYWDGQSRAIS
jgi:fatty-acyl-CoA synthase/long-chain acyl-CoA synthetase